ncbi:hypothetical protein LUD75_18430 [Epilithonimonas sp. JDS]|uniref:hypothetical protein n=1 Tax=Epilithonimonas sp. JDS TaxID=2902797 RepID=UPI001E64A717|nr:hypothetical protein [Epilithonimonas sp. JDS]MCD9856707.1 hypothetical protein [Epilithonimonas sp. JDS]
MKKYLVIPFVFIQLIFFGQTKIIPDAANRRDHPVELRAALWDINDGYKTRLKPQDRNFKDPEFKKIKYSPEQLDRIIYLLKNDVVPSGLRKGSHEENRALMPYYKSYWVGNLKIDGNFYCVIYIPKKENMHMPAEYIPETDEGTFVSVYVSVPKFAGIKLAGTKPPSPEALAKAQNGNVTFSYANLSRWNNTEGMVIFWFGTSASATSYKAYSVKFGNTVSEETVVQNLKSKYISDSGYVGYSFNQGSKCSDLYSDIARKMKISLESARDLRLGSCSDNVINFE